MASPVIWVSAGIRRTVNVPAVLDHSGMSRTDGKRPDDITFIPWRMRRAVVGDDTRDNTLSPSHPLNTSKRGGFVAKLAERTKSTCISVMTIYSHPSESKPLARGAKCLANSDFSF